MPKYRTKYPDLAGRWKAGEVGEVVNPAEPFKYDFWLDFGELALPEGTELFGQPLTGFRRVFGFMKYEVEAVV